MTTHTSDTRPVTAGPVAPRRTDLLAEVPLPGRSVRLDPEGYLGRWQDLNATATIPHSMRMLEESGTLDNLRRVVGRADADYTGYQFADSDVHKLLEAIGWEIARTGTRDFDEFLTATVALLEEVQDDDGYLDSHFQGTGGPGEPREKFSDLRWGHELYCAGHMIQAAVALSRAGRDDLLVIARRTADLLVRRAAERGVPDVDGHPEAETALVELYRHTGEVAYLDLAEQMIEARGRGVLGPDRLGPHYFQDHAPVRESTEATGHAVRQLYLDAGVTDLYTERGDRTLLEAMVSQWETAHHEKMYLTGAMGSRHFDESFGDAYELPPDRAYAETCASIADVQWSRRMLLVDRDARYADAMERALHNSIRSSLSQDGTAFFYSNPLQLRAGHREEENAPSRRTPWYHCACCPPNIARLVASLAEYVATSSADTLSVHLYGAARIDVPAHLGSGRVTVRTAYPQDGDVRVVLDGTLRPGARLALRVPAWARDWTLTVDGAPSDAVRGADGYVTVDAGFRETRLVLPMPVDLVAAHPRVDAVRGCVAITRGPVVYCLEQADHEDVPVEDLRLHLDGPLDLGEPAPGGLPTVRATGSVTAPADGPGALYAVVGQEVATAPQEDVVVTAVPYADWGNRETGPMRVWVPVHRAVTE